MHLARCELVQCVVTLVALLDCPGLHIVRGASQPTSVLWPLAPCVDAAEMGDEATWTVTRSSWGATRRSSTPADFFCAYLVSFILRVCHSGMCRVRRLASLRYGLEEAGRAEDLVLMSRIIEEIMFAGITWASFLRIVPRTHRWIHGIRAGRLCICQMAPRAIATPDSHAALHQRLPSLVASSGVTQPGDVHWWNFRACNAIAPSSRACVYDQLFERVQKK